MNLTFPFFRHRTNVFSLFHSLFLPSGRGAHLDSAPPPPPSNTMAKVGFATESHLCLGAVVVQVGVSQSVRQTQLLPPPHKISQQFLHCISNSHFFFQVARSLAVV